MAPDRCTVKSIRDFPPPVVGRVVAFRRSGFASGGSHRIPNFKRAVARDIEGQHSLSAFAAAGRRGQAHLRAAWLFTRADVVADLGGLLMPLAPRH